MIRQLGGSRFCSEVATPSQELINEVERSETGQEDPPRLLGARPRPSRVGSEAEKTDGEALAIRCFGSRNLRRLYWQRRSYSSYELLHPATVADVSQPDTATTSVPGYLDERLAGLPEASETRVLDTWFGSWTWTRHDADVSTLDREYPFPDAPMTEEVLPEGPWLGFDSVDVVVNDKSGIAVAAMRALGQRSPEAPYGSPKASDPPSTLYSWTSSDGTTWREFSPPISAGSTVGFLELEAAGEQIELLVVGADGDTGSIWTANTSGWQQVQDLGIGEAWFPGSNLAATPSGWMMAWTGPTQGEHCEVWVSPDGLAWERIDYTPFIGFPLDAQHACYVAGDVIAARIDDSSEGTVWIGRFGP